VHERESADLAAILIRQAVLAEGCLMPPLVLHADNGSPMKGATMKVTMEKLGITASYSRPRVSNDNPPRQMLKPGSKASLVGTTANTCTAPSASSRRMRATQATIIQRSQIVPISMQLLARKTRNAGQEKLETGNPQDPSG
jgi:hypothetical protein